MPLPRPHRPLALSAAAVLLGAVAVATPAAASTVTFTQPELIDTGGSKSGSTGAQGSGTSIPDASSEGSGVATSAIGIDHDPDATVDATVTRVDVQVVVTHAYLDDLDLVLEAPDGRTVTLASDIGGAGSGTSTLTFDDSLPPLSDEADVKYGAPVDYDTAGDRDDHPDPAPTSLRAFSGATADGDWTLYAYDDTRGGTGSVESWDLHVSYAMPPNPSLLSVSGLTRNVTDVNLVLHDVNGRPYDTELLLESPDGRYAHVLSDIVDEGEHLEKVDLRLDDEAAADIPRVDAPVSGSYRPANYDDGDQSEFFGGVDTMDMDARLSAFDGGLANGTWKLWMLQEYCCEVVTIGGWSLEITTEDPPAARHPGHPGRRRHDCTGAERRQDRAEASAHRRPSPAARGEHRGGAAGRPGAAEEGRQVEASRHQTLVGTGRDQHAHLLRQGRPAPVEVGRVSRVARRDRRRRQRLGRGPATVPRRPRLIPG